MVIQCKHVFRWDKGKLGQNSDGDSHANMSSGGIRVNKGEILMVIQCKYICRWGKGESG
jgi:hypothetical protein